MAIVTPAIAAPAADAPELCGTGRLPLRGLADSAATDAFGSLPAPIGELALQELQDRLLRTLAAGDARQRMAAWLMRQPQDTSAQPAWAAALLAEARISGDAQALRWAATACGHTHDDAGCRHELARSRVRAEPDNGLHWLEWAQVASTAAEQAQAWEGLVQARSWHEHPTGLTVVTQSALADLQPAPAAYLRARLARETLGRDAARPLEGTEWLAAQCALHRGGCIQIAERLAAGADSAALLQLAGRLGRELGWSEERLQAMTTATQSFHAQLPAWREEALTSLSCAAVEPQLAHIEAMARHGEVPGAR